MIPRDGNLQRQPLCVSQIKHHKVLNENKETRFVKVKFETMYFLQQG